MLPACVAIHTHQTLQPAHSQRASSYFPTTPHATSCVRTALSRYLSTVPTAVFEASIPGVRQFTLGARAACYVVKGLEYALSGMAAGFVGQGVSNTLMVARCVGGWCSYRCMVLHMCIPCMVWSGVDI